MTTHRMMSALGEYVEIVIPDNYYPPPAIHLRMKVAHGGGRELFVLVPPSEMDERDTPVPTLTHLLHYGRDFPFSQRVLMASEGGPHRGVTLGLPVQAYQQLEEPSEVTVRIMRPIAQRNDPSDPEALPHDPDDEPSSDAR